MLPTWANGRPAAASLTATSGQRLQPQDIQALLQLFTAGTITQETLLQQLSEGEVLGDDFDVEGGSGGN